MSETTENPIRDAINEAIGEHEVILFMKGTPGAADVRLLGAHRRGAGGARQALRRRRRPARSADPPGALGDLELADDPAAVREGELVGGCDIVTEMYESGELAQVMGVEPPSDAPAEAPAAAEPGAPPLQIDNKLT